MFLFYNPLKHQKTKKGNVQQKLLNSIFKKNSKMEEIVAIVLGFSVKLLEVTDELDHKNTEKMF